MENVKILQIQKILKVFFIIIFGSLLITLSAKIKIPFYPVPMTMQTFMIILIGASLFFNPQLVRILINSFAEPSKIGTSSLSISTSALSIPNQNKAPIKCLSLIHI